MRDCPIQKWPLCAPSVAKINIWRLGFHFLAAGASDQEYLQLKQEKWEWAYSTQIEIAVWFAWNHYEEIFNITTTHVDSYVSIILWKAKLNNFGYFHSYPENLYNIMVMYKSDSNKITSQWGIVIYTKGRRVLALCEICLCACCHNLNCSLQLHSRGTDPLH